MTHLWSWHCPSHSAWGPSVLHLALLLLLGHHLLLLGTLLVLHHHHLSLPLLLLLHRRHLLWICLRALLHHRVSLHGLLHALLLPLHVGDVLDLIRHHVAVVLAVLAHLLLLQHLHLVRSQLILLGAGRRMHRSGRRCAVLHCSCRAVWSHSWRLRHLSIRHSLGHIGSALCDLRSIATLAGSLLLAHLPRHLMLHARRRPWGATRSLTRGWSHWEATLRHHRRRVHHRRLLSHHWTRLRH